MEIKEFEKTLESLRVSVTILETEDIDTGDHAVIEVNPNTFIKYIREWNAKVIIFRDKEDDAAEYTIWCPEANAFLTTDLDDDE
jgi:hypothetical protein